MSQKPAAPRHPRRVLGVAAALAAVLGLSAGADVLNGSDARAQVAAKVESQTRPNFGILLDPPTRTRPMPPPI